MNQRAIKYRVWDKRTSQMHPVAAISFGDDGSAQTIMAEIAPTIQHQVIKQFAAFCNFMYWQYYYPSSGTERKKRDEQYMQVVHLFQDLSIELEAAMDVVDDQVTVEVERDGKKYRGTLQLVKEPAHE